MYASVDREPAEVIAEELTGFHKLDCCNVELRRAVHEAAREFCSDKVCDSVCFSFPGSVRDGPLFTASRTEQRWAALWAAVFESSDVL